MREDCGSKLVKILTRSSKPLEVEVFVKKLGVNKTTVYRQIEKLLSKNVLVEVEFGDGKKRYELKSLGHHHHVICKKCGTLDDVQIDERILLEAVSKKTDFKIETHNLEFFGYCKKCI